MSKKLGRRETRALFEKFATAFKACDVETLCECVTEDFEWRLPVGTEAPVGELVRGKDGLRKAFQSERAAMMKAVDAWTEDLMIDKQFITQRYRIRGTLPNGVAIDIYGLDCYTVRDGLIATKDAYWKNIRDA